MSTSRRDIFTGLGLGVAAFALPGCCGPKCGPRKRVNAKIALQLYSIGTYIAGRKDKNGNRCATPVKCDALIPVTERAASSGVSSSASDTSRISRRFCRVATSSRRRV